MSTPPRKPSRGRRQLARRHGRDAADHHRDDYGDRHEGSVDHIHRSEQLEVQLPCRGHQGLKQVKVGDKLDITWTEALLVGFTQAKK